MGDTAQAQEKLRTYQQLKKARSDTTQAAGKAEVGDQAMASGNAAQAASLYKEALETDPDEPLLFYKLSRALDKMKDFAGEKRHSSGHSMNPNLAEAQNQMGYLADRDGDLAQAEGYFASRCAFLLPMSSHGSTWRQLWRAKPSGRMQKRHWATLSK